MTHEETDPRWPVTPNHVVVDGPTIAERDSGSFLSTGYEVRGGLRGEGHKPQPMWKLCLAFAVLCAFVVYIVWYQLPVVVSK